jgi:hypothetical protein
LLLADPDRHWREGYSAHSLAFCWEACSGLPAEILELFTQVGEKPELLIAIPEHKVPLRGGGRESQTDIFALVRAGSTTISTAVEGKVNEPFGPTVAEWLLDASGGKRDRLAHIRELLGLSDSKLDGIHYQLMHRTASAVIEAQRFKTDAAAMIVHSFSPTAMWFEAFRDFAALFGQQAEVGRMSSMRLAGGMPLYLGWAKGKRA